jgi:hypothetical protein
MKVLTVTAILALFLGVPLFLRKCRTRLQPVRHSRKPVPGNDQRYDIDDLLS